jgi:uncharacterized integral membrane protein
MGPGGRPACSNRKFCHKVSYKKGGAVKNPKIISAVVLAVLFVIFLIQNTQVVTLHVYFWEISMSQIILISLVLVLGFILGYFVRMVTGKHEKRREPQRP